MEQHQGHFHIKDAQAVATMDLMNVPEHQREEIRKRAEFMREHSGHEQMHAQMVMILLISMAVGQVILFAWKRTYPQSFQRLTLIGMWIIPVLISIQSEFYRFIVLWVLFSSVTGYVAYLASRNPLNAKTPRFVYTFFVAVYKSTYFVGSAGYILMFMDFAFGGVTLRSVGLMEVGLLVMFYCLYYGILGRDIAEVCTDKMASTIGYTNTAGLPKKKLDPNVCAICSEDLPPVGLPDSSLNEKVVTLSCNHLFHEFCIRGWCIVGKKQTCPYCKEKVDLKQMFRNPWEKQDLMYGNFLDVFRYLLVWQPVIMKLVNWYFSFSGLQ